MTPTDPRRALWFVPAALVLAWIGWRAPTHGQAHHRADRDPARALAWRDDHPEALINHATALAANAGTAGEAEALARKALAAHPLDGRGHRVLGQAAKPQALNYLENMSLVDVMIAVGGVIGGVLLLVGAPIWATIGLASASYIWVQGFPTHLIVQRMFNNMDSFLLLAVPMFMLAGEVMNTSGLTARLLDLAHVLLRRLRAGLAMANLGTNMMMAGISGSALADASALTALMKPRVPSEPTSKWLRMSSGWS